MTEKTARPSPELLCRDVETWGSLELLVSPGRISITQYFYPERASSISLTLEVRGP